MSETLDFVKVDVQAFFKRLGVMKFGTGTIASAVGVHNDEIQRLITLEECPVEVARKLVDLLGGTILLGDVPELDATVPEEVIDEEPDEEVADEEEEEDEDEDGSEPDLDFYLDSASVAATLEAVDAGVVSAADVIAAEQSREHPRKSLLSALGSEPGEE